MDNNEKNNSVTVGPLRPKGLEVTPAEKAEWVRRFRQSGLTLRKFSVQYGLRVSSLCSWTSRYPEDACKQPQEPGFVEMQLPVLTQRPSWSVELSLGNGKILRLNGEVPEAVLEQVLRVC